MTSEPTFIILWRVLGIVTFLVFLVLNKQLAESQHRNVVKRLGVAPPVIFLRLIGYMISAAILLFALFANFEQ